MVYHDFSYLTVHWKEEVPCVLMEWKVFARDADFRAGLDAGLKLLESKGADKWLADLRKLGTVTNLDQEWANANWFPRALASGIKFMAIVIPESALSRFNVDSIMGKVEGTDLVTQNFDSVDKAVEWLKDQ
jgi:hypothetical protein